MRTRLVLGENAAQAARFATAGGTQAGVSPLPLALAPELRGLGSHAAITADLHRPTKHKVTLLKGAGESASARLGSAAAATAL